MNEFLIVVDMQNDFVNGALGSADAVDIVPRVCEVIRDFKGEVIYTRDTHTDGYLETNEGKNLPVVHCVKDTHGWELNPDVASLAGGAKIIDKPTFGSFELCEYLAKRDEKTRIDRITLVGLCTDICVLSNAIMLKAALPEAEIRVDASACAGVSVSAHRAALASMKSCQIKIDNE